MSNHMETYTIVLKRVRLSKLMLMFYVPSIVLGDLCWSLFWYALLFVFSSFATILTRKRERVTLLSDSIKVPT